MADSRGCCVHENVSTDHKSANRIKFSQLVQELFHLSDLKPQVWSGWIGGWVVWVDGWVDVYG